MALLVLSLRERACSNTRLMSSGKVAERCQRWGTYRRTIITIFKQIYSCHFPAGMQYSPGEAQAIKEPSVIDNAFGTIVD